MFDFNQTKYAKLERDARHLAESIAEVMKEEGAEVSDMAHEKVEHIKERARAMKDTAQEKAQDLDAFANENVWMTAAVAAAIGAVVGSLIFRRRR